MHRERPDMNGSGKEEGASEAVLIGKYKLSSEYSENNGAAEPRLF